MKLFNRSHSTNVTVSTETIVRAIVLIVAAYLALRFMGRIQHQLELFVISAFLAIALNPAVSRLSNWFHIKKRILASGLAYVIVMSLLIGFLSLVVPPLVRQTNTFFKDVPHTISNLSDTHSAPGRIVQRYHLQSQIDNLSVEAKSKLSQAPTLAFDAASRVGGVFISVITIIVLTFMMLVEGPQWLERLWSLTPEEKHKPYKEMAHKMYKIVTGYVNGQVFIAALASVFAFTALTIGSTVTHTSVNAVALSGIVFLFGLIPLIGNTLAAIIVVIICLFSSTSLALIMLVYFPVYQQIENSTLQPHIQAKNNQLTPLLVFMAALVGAGFGGLLGAFVAIPAAGCLRVFLEYRYGETLAPTLESVKKTIETQKA
jgi:predicted PurR-regulated permease PerM